MRDAIVTRGKSRGAHRSPHYKAMKFQFNDIGESSAQNLVTNMTNNFTEASTISDDTKQPPRQLLSAALTKRIPKVKVTQASEEFTVLSALMNQLHSTKVQDAASVTKEHEF